LYSFVAAPPFAAGQTYPCISVHIRVIRGLPFCIHSRLFVSFSGHPFCRRQYLSVHIRVIRGLPFCIPSRLFVSFRGQPLFPQAILIRAYPCHPWPAFLYSFVRFCAPSWPTPFAAGNTYPCISVSSVACLSVFLRAFLCPFVANLFCRRQYLSVHIRVIRGLPFCIPSCVFVSLRGQPLLPQAILIRAYPCHPWPAFLYSFEPFCDHSWPPLLPQAILIRAYPCHPWPAFLYSFVRFCAPSWPTSFAAGNTYPCISVSSVACLSVFLRAFLCPFVATPFAAGNTYPCISVSSVACLSVFLRAFLCPFVANPFCRRQKKPVPAPKGSQNRL